MLNTLIKPQDGSDSLGLSWPGGPGDEVDEMEKGAASPSIAKDFGRC